MQNERTHSDKQLQDWIKGEGEVDLERLSTADLERTADLDTSVISLKHRQDVQKWVTQQTTWENVPYRVARNYFLPE